MSQTPLWLGLLGPAVALLGVTAAWLRAGRALHLQEGVHWELINADGPYRLINGGRRTAYCTEYHLASPVVEISDRINQRDPRDVQGGGSFEFHASMPFGVSERHVTVTWYDSAKLSGRRHEWRTDLPQRPRN